MDEKVEAEEGHVGIQRDDRCRILGLDTRELEEARRACGIHVCPNPCVFDY